MALSRTTLGTVENLSAVSTATISSVALSTGDLLVVAASSAFYPNAQEITGITWNGNALTLGVEQVGSGDNSQWMHAAIYYLQIASGGTGNIVVTCGGNNDGIWAAALKYTGHDTGTPIGDTDSQLINNSDATNPSLTLTTAAGDEVVSCLGEYVQFGNTFTLGGGETSIYEDADATPIFGIGVAIKPAAGASTTVGWTKSVNYGFDYCAAVIKAAAGGGSSIVPILNSYRLRRSN